jgi:hypothetical protein
MNKCLLAICSLVALLGLAGVVWAQVPSGTQSAEQTYDLNWHTVDGGGYTWSSGGIYTLGGTVGQPDAGNLAGGSYVLVGGFWEGGPAAQRMYRIYLPLVLRSYTP